MLEQAVYAGRNHAVSLAVAVLALFAAPASAQPPAPVEVGRLGLGSAFGELIGGPDGGVWMRIDRSLVGQKPSGLWDDAIGHATTDDRFRRVTVEGPVFGGRAALGPDGQAWFPSGGTLYRSDAEGTVTSGPLTRPIGDVATRGPDGALWSAEGITRTLLRADAQGTVTTLPFALPAGCDDPTIFFEMTTAIDGAVWLADDLCRRLVRIAPDGTSSTVALTADDRVAHLAPDRAGGIWLALRGDPYGVAHVDAAGTLRRWPLPEDRGPVVGIAVAQDGVAHLAFGRCELGRITPDGALTFGAAPIPAEHLAFDPQGGLWLASPNRLVHAPAPPLARAACDDTPPRVTLSPTLRGPIRLARLRRGVRITVREPAVVGVGGDYGDDDHDSRQRIFRARRGGSFVFHVPKAALRRLERAVAAGRKPVISLYFEAGDRDGNVAQTDREEILVTR